MQRLSMNLQGSTSDENPDDIGAPAAQRPPVTARQPFQPLSCNIAAAVHASTQLQQKQGSLYKPVPRPLASQAATAAAKGAGGQQLSDEACPEQHPHKHASFGAGYLAGTSWGDHKPSQSQGMDSTGGVCPARQAAVHHSCSCQVAQACMVHAGQQLNTLEPVGVQGISACPQDPVQSATAAAACQVGSVLDQSSSRVPIGNLSCSTTEPELPCTAGSHIYTMQHQQGLSTTSAQQDAGTLLVDPAWRPSMSAEVAAYAHALAQADGSTHQQQPLQHPMADFRPDAGVPSASCIYSTTSGPVIRLQLPGLQAIHDAPAAAGSISTAAGEYGTAHQLGTQGADTAAALTRFLQAHRPLQEAGSMAAQHPHPSLLAVSMSSSSVSRLATSSSSRMHACAEDQPGVLHQAPSCKQALPTAGPAGVAPAVAAVQRHLYSVQQQSSQAKRAAFCRSGQGTNCLRDAWAAQPAQHVQDVASRVLAGVSLHEAFAARAPSAMRPSHAMAGFAARCSARTIGRRYSTGTMISSEDAGAWQGTEVSQKQWQQGLMAGLRPLRGPAMPCQLQPECTRQGAVGSWQLGPLLRNKLVPAAGGVHMGPMGRSIIATAAAAAAMDPIVASAAPGRVAHPTQQYSRSDACSSSSASTSGPGSMQHSGTCPALPPLKPSQLHAGGRQVPYAASHSLAASSSAAALLERCVLTACNTRAAGAADDQPQSSVGSSSSSAGLMPRPVGRLPTPLLKLPTTGEPGAATSGSMVGPLLPAGPRQVKRHAACADTSSSSSSSNSNNNVPASGTMYIRQQLQLRYAAITAGTAAPQHCRTMQDTACSQGRAGPSGNSDVGPRACSPAAAVRRHAARGSIPSPPDSPPGDSGSSAPALVSCIPNSSCQLDTAVSGRGRRDSSSSGGSLADTAQSRLRYLVPDHLTCLSPYAGLTPEDTDYVRDALAVHHGCGHHASYPFVIAMRNSCNATKACRKLTFGM